MNFKSQVEPLSQLKICAETNKHSLLITGTVGSGKTHLAKRYAEMLHIRDMKIVSPKVSELKEVIAECLLRSSKLVLIIENLDLGVSAASYAILKFLEEPKDNIYIVVTCRNINNIPDTIVSRTVCVNVNPPTEHDLTIYATSKNLSGYEFVKDKLVWKCARTLNDVDNILLLDVNQVQYFENLKNIIRFNDTVSNIMWKLQHYDGDDKKETPLELTIRCLMESYNSKHINEVGIECISDLAQGRIAKHVALAKFIFECKYASI